MGSFCSKESKDEKYSKNDENKKEKKLTPINFKQIGLENIDKSFEDIAQPFNDMLHSKENMEKSMKSFKALFKKDEEESLKNCFRELKRIKVRNLRPRLVKKNNIYTIEFSGRSVTELFQSIQKAFQNIVSTATETKNIITDSIKNVKDLSARKDEYVQEIRNFFSIFNFYKTGQAVKNAILNFMELSKIPGILQGLLNEITSIFEEIKECVTLLEDDDEKGHIMLLYQDWTSSNGGLSTFYRELCINLAEFGRSNGWRVSCLLNDVTQTDLAEAEKDLCVEIIEGPPTDTSTKPEDGLSQYFEKIVLNLQTEDQPTVIIGHTLATGVAARRIQRNLKCRRIQFLHEHPKDLAITCRGGSSTQAQEEKVKELMELCQEANVTVMAIGPTLKDVYTKELQDCQKEVLDFTPGLNRRTQEAKEPDDTDSSMLKLVIVCRDQKDIGADGLRMDLASEALAWLTKENRPVSELIGLTYIGAAETDERSITEWFLRETRITAENLQFKSFTDQEGIVQTLNSADLLLMPSRAKDGFDLIAFEAISAATAIVLLSNETGLAVAMNKGNIGYDNIVESKEPRFWAERVEAILKKPRKHRLRDAKNLRLDYEEAFSWLEACRLLESRILDTKTQKDEKSISQDSSEIQVVADINQANINQDD